MIETQILHQLLSHTAWVEYSPAVDWAELKNQTPELYRVYLALKKWHEEKHSDITLPEFQVWFFLQYPGLSDKQQAVYQGLLGQAGRAEIREELVGQYMQQMKDSQTRRTLAVMAMDAGVTNDKIVEQAATLLLHNADVVQAVQEYVTTDLDELMKISDEQPGLKWRLACLNKSVGQLRKSMFGVILARVETGKTAMWVSEASHMVGQIGDDEHVVVFFNEEDGNSVMWRFYSAVTGMTAEELESHPIEAQELFYQRGGQRLKFIDNAHQHYSNVAKTLDTLQPRLIIMDNLDEIKGFERDERQDVGLGKLYRWARELAKDYAPVLGVCQSSITMQKKWLTEMDMANSKVAKPAALDFLIGIGRIEDAGYEYVRYINIPKNKRRGMRGADERDRHGKFQTILIPELSIYRDAA